MTAEDLIYILYNYFGVTSNIDLAEKLNTTQQTISNWKTRNSVAAIRKKCRELGIYNDIFGDSHVQQIVTSNSGQNAMHVGGDQIFDKDSTRNADDIDPATYNLFLEAYKKAVSNDDLKSLRVHLMEY